MVEGKVPTPRAGTLVIKKTIKIGNKSLLMTTHESNSSIIIYIGGHDTYCIDAQILKPSSKEPVTIGNLTKIRFDVNCSLEHNFVRGFDTNMILKLLLTYIHDIYPTTKAMRFSDASTQTCDNGFSVDLSEMLYLITGKTWYEKNFGAYLDGYSLENFKTLETGFQAKKSTISWEMMKDIITTDLPLTDDEMKQLYDSAVTWQDFFGGLSEKIGIPEMCNFMAPWLHRFIQQYFRFNFMANTYMIPVGDYKIPYTVLEYKNIRGGRRFTRKRVKLPMRDER